jgi:hypothetical protein
LERKILFCHFHEAILEEDKSCAPTGQPKAFTKITMAMANQRMLQAAVQYGSKRPLFMDTTFAMNRYKFSFLSILAMDDHGHGLPVCWAIMPDEKLDTITAVLRAFKAAVLQIKRDWQPSCFLTDDCAAEQRAVECTLATYD